ncbi:MAG: glycine cleavage system protein H [Planctomycetes bacterium]|nr:glycine cleavage system protein H [Planctomycetota bacterium]
MADSLTFMMGKFAAVLPADRRYARNHMWCMQTGDRLRFGFTSYAMRLMQDVYFLDWEVNPGDVVELKQKVGHIETSKAMSDLFAPIAGTLIRFNSDVLNDPSVINVDNYGNGWLFETVGSDADTLNVQEYHDFLAAGWEKTQNMLKGHM